VHHTSTNEKNEVSQAKFSYPHNYNFSLAWNSQLNVCPAWAFETQIPNDKLQLTISKSWQEGIRTLL
jgi:hypothetical protein